VNTTETEVDAPSQCSKCGVRVNLGADGFCGNCREDDAAVESEPAGGPDEVEGDDVIEPEPADERDAAVQSGEQMEDAEYPRHPRAVLFPDHSQTKFVELKVSIRDHGQQQPIEVQGGTRLLLDGRHRLRACRDLEIAPKIREVEIADHDVPLYTATKAAQREGLTATQKMLLALELLPSLQVGSGKTADRAATAVGVCRAYVERGIALRDHALDLFERMKAGELGLSPAWREYRLGLDGKHEVGDDDSAVTRTPDQPELEHGDDDAYRLPERLRPPLAAITESVGGIALGDGVDAMIAHCRHCAAWKTEAEALKTATGR